MLQRGLMEGHAVRGKLRDFKKGTLVVMKKCLFVVICGFVLVPFTASAQVREGAKVEEPATKLEAFLAKKGKLIIKDVYELGEVAGSYGSKIEFDVLVIYEPGQESQRVRGVKIKVSGGGKYERSDTSFLDFEEVESLSRAIEYMVDLLSKWEGVNKGYTEVIFSTKGDFQIGFFQQGTKRRTFASSGRIGKATCFFPLEGLSSIKSIVNRGLDILKVK